MSPALLRGGGAAEEGFDLYVHPYGSSPAVTCSRVWGPILFEHSVLRLSNPLYLKNKNPTQTKNYCNQFTSWFPSPSSCLLELWRTIPSILTFPTLQGEVNYWAQEGREVKERKSTAVKFTGDARILQTLRVCTDPWETERAQSSDLTLPGFQEPHRVSTHRPHHHVCSLLGLTRAPTGTGRWWF